MYVHRYTHGFLVAMQDPGAERQHLSASRLWSRHSNRKFLKAIRCGFICIAQSIAESPASPLCSCCAQAAGPGGSGLLRFRRMRWFWPKTCGQTHEGFGSQPRAGTSSGWPMEREMPRRKIAKIQVYVCSRGTTRQSRRLSDRRKV